MSFSVTGPEILFSLFGITITETVVNSWILIAVITLLCIFLTRDMRTKNPSKKQLVAEKLYTMAYTLVTDVMGKDKAVYVPFIGALFSASVSGSLISLFGLRPVTADLSTTLGWGILTFFMVQYTNIKNNGVRGWAKSFLRPVAVLAPLNVISELANPVSIAFRHFGNIASGVVITSLLYWALGSAVDVFGVPVLQVGLPAVLSVYFDLFTSFLQAYIISMLTMVFVASV